MATIEVSTLENNSIQINIDNNEENNYIAKLENEIGNLTFLIEALAINMNKKEKQIKRLENIIRDSDKHEDYPAVLELCDGYTTEVQE